MKALIIRVLLLILIYEGMRARALRFCLTLSHTFLTDVLQNLIYKLS